MTIQNLEIRRREFAAVSRQEAQLRIGQGEGAVRIDSSQVYAELDHIFANMINLIPEVANEIADNLVAGESAWPVRTGYSRSRWRGGETGISNDASYASYVEERQDEPALSYVQSTAQQTVDDVIRRRDGSARRRLGR